MTISMIVAAAENNAIGKNNQMLWHLPEDFKYFKNQTWGLPILMGRRTYQALGGKALPGRVNIILSRNKDFEAADALVVNKWKDAVFVAQEHDYGELMVIGGAEIYTLMLPEASKILLTRVHANFDDADAFFPKLSNDWSLISTQDFPKDEKNGYDYSFEIWQRKA